jgi:hypothetical protein
MKRIRHVEQQGADELLSGIRPRWSKNDIRETPDLCSVAPSVSVLPTALQGTRVNIHEF